RAASRWRSQRLPKILDRLLDTFVEFNSWFPSEDFFRAGDVRLAHLRVVHRQRFVVDCGFRSCDSNNFVGKLFDGHLARVAQVDRLVKIARREFENSVDKIGYVTKRARLRAIAEDAQWLSAQRLPDKRRHDATVAQPHPRAVRVEDADDPGVHAMIAVISHG